VEIVVPVVVIDIPIIVVGGCRTKARAASPAPWRGESRQARQKSCCPAATASNTIVSSSGTMVVLSHGIADPTTIYSGGSPLMRSRLRSTASPCPGAPEVGTGQGEAEPEMFQCHCDTGLLNLTKFR
jgi:autotransporter passenger strand-loop-strand repeat protein